MHTDSSLQGFLEEFCNRGDTHSRLEDQRGAQGGNHLPLLTTPTHAGMPELESERQQQEIQHDNSDEQPGKLNKE